MTGISTVSVETGAIVVRGQSHDSLPEGWQTEFRHGHLARRVEAV